MSKAQATQERILKAALAEFSAYGIAGARVDRIAKAAKCNKNLIYIYFQDKETLFATVLEKHLERVYDETMFTPGDLPGYAAKLFDFAMGHRDLLRLIAWFALERKGPTPAHNAATRESKIEALKKAQKLGQVDGSFPPAFLLVAIISLATAWSDANPFGAAMDAEGTKRPAVLRKHVAEAVRRLTMRC